MLPFECAVPGVPISLQTRSRANLRTWRTKVAHHAALLLPPGEDPTDDPVSLSIVYFYDAEPLDTDNMIKPIQDAMVGLVYTDDAQVKDVTAAVRDLNGRFEVRGMSAELARGFSYGAPFVYIRVTPAPDPGVLL